MPQQKMIVNYFSFLLHDVFICPLTNQIDAIRYLSLHDNQYLRYFSGHQKRVTSLDLCPVNDMFISASIDDSVRIWDLRSPNCIVIFFILFYFILFSFF